jgi:UDP:flavonoid glycosyltransferase YjiC (YdhE family)
MKIAFAIIPEKGHINPYIGPAQALQDLGHHVILAAPGDISAQLHRAGLPFHPALIPPQTSARPTTGPELVALIQNPARLDAWIEQLLLDHLEPQIAANRAWLQHERPDAVVVDPLYYPAAIATHLESIPWINVSNSLNPVIPPNLDSALLRTIRRLTPRRADLFRTHGMHAQFSGPDILSPYLNIAFATEAFVGPAPAGVHLVGPSFPLRSRGDEVPFHPLPKDRPIVYASFGSQLTHWPHIFEKLLAAGDRLNVHTILAGRHYAPQLAILPHAAAFITHGGANSVMEGIAAGVPFLISPMCNDQFHQAWFIERTGIGCVENLIHAPVDRIFERLQYLLHDPAPKSAMSAVSATYQVNGAVRAAQLIADTCRSHRPQ